MSAIGFQQLSFVDFSGATSLWPLVNGQQLPIKLLHAGDLFKNDCRYAVTPICLSGPSQFEAETELSKLAGCPENIAAGFIQTRVPTLNENKQGHFDGGLYIKDVRTTYQLPLISCQQTRLAAMKKDSKGHIKKLLKLSGQVTFRLANCDSDIREFAAIYQRQAQQHKYVSQYQFTLEQWTQLLSNPQWQLYCLEHNDQLVAGCVVAQVDNGFDYTFMAHKKGSMDYSRALIWCLTEYLAQNHSGFLNLGGGITEGDSLARYKLSMGAIAVYFARYKFVVTGQLVANHSDDELYQLMNGRWPVL